MLRSDGSVQSHSIKIKNSIIIDSNEIIEVVCAIILKEDKVFMARRSKEMKQPLMWEFVGGKMKSIESPEKALLREVKEETNLEIEIIARLQDYIHQYPDNTIRLIPFVAKYVQDEVELTEHQEYTWESPKKLGNYHLSAADRPVLENFLRWYKHNKDKI